MGRYKNLLTIFTLAVMVMGLSIVASAQWRNDRNNRNTGYYGNTNLNSTIKNLKNNSKRFEKVLDRELDRSRYDGTRREDALNGLADRFKDAVRDLDDEYDNSRDYNRSRDEVRQVLSTGQQLGNALQRSRAIRNSSVQSYWRNIQNDLNIIARSYNVRNNDRYGNDNRNNRGNNRGNNGNNGRWGRNDNRNGRNNGNSRNLRATIVNLKNKSSRFEDRVDRERNNSRYGRNNNGLESAVNRFNDAVKDLEDEYDNNRDYNDSFDEVRRVLSYGEQVDREISQGRVDRNLQSEWNSIEQDLRVLAQSFNIGYNGRNGNSRGYGIGDIIRNFPF